MIEQQLKVRSVQECWTPLPTASTKLMPRPDQVANPAIGPCSHENENMIGENILNLLLGQTEHPTLPSIADLHAQHASDIGLAAGN
jgi:hypothetical protein